jgi:hypothetical protein
MYLRNMRERNNEKTEKLFTSENIIFSSGSPGLDLFLFFERAFLTLCAVIRVKIHLVRNTTEYSAKVK